MCKHCDDWIVSGRLARREIRQDHGGGPEEMPYRKKGKGKKYCNKNKGPHVYDTWTGFFTYPTFRYRYRACKCGKHLWSERQTQYLREFTYYINGEPHTEKRWF